MSATINNSSYRFYLVNDLERRQISPTGGIKIGFELQENTYFYKHKVGTFNLNDKDGDYSWVKAIENAGEICKELYIEVERKCLGSGWELFVKNKWTIQNCTINDVLCTIKVNPESFGIGTCMQEIGGAQLNMLEAMRAVNGGLKYSDITYIDDYITTDLIQYNNGHMFYYNAAGIENILIRPQYTNASGNPSTSGTPSVEPTADELFTGGFIPENEVDLIAIHRVGVYQQTVLSPPWVIYVAWAYRRAEFKVAGQCPETPNGYTYIGDDATYCYFQKKPTDEDRSVTLPVGFDRCNNILPAGSNTDLVYNGVMGTQPGIPAEGLCLYVIHKDSNPLQSLYLSDALKRLVEQCDPDVIPVSDFFQINPENPSGTNYVTNQPTLVNDIRLIQRSDVIFQWVQDAVNGYISFEELDAFLRNSFQVYWSEMANGNLRLEHVSFYETMIVGLDATTGDKKEYTQFKGEYTYKKELLPFVENVADDGNHHNYNWDDREIKYVDTDGYKLPCVGNETLERSFGSFNTDLEFFLEYPTDISRAGWVVVACKSEFGDSQVLYEDGLLNGTLSLSRLIERYYQHDRSALNAKVNDVDTVFQTRKRIKTQEGLSFPLCCNDVFDPRKTIKTILGEGKIVSAELELKTNKLTTNNEY